jgi:GNAT superfamily N-acetyltransferase
MERLRRRWVIAPISSPEIVPLPDLSVRNTVPADDAALAALLDESYEGTIDADPDADHADEVRTWREVDFADDEASWVAVDGARLVATSMIGRELGAPFLYEIATSPSHRRTGVARRLLSASMRALADRGEPHLAAWVTAGNQPSERLLAGLGFTPVTAPLRRYRALGLYRAAQAVRQIDVPKDAPLAASSLPDGVTLWVIAHAGPSMKVDVGGVTVSVELVSPADDRIPTIAATSVPLRGASWLLAQRA